MPVPISKKAQSKKLQQFLKELNELCDEYQYKLQPILNYSQQGIVPTLSVNDVPPKKSKKKPKRRKKS